MASIYRREGSKVYQCAFYIPSADGGTKKVRKSTGKTSRKDALAVAVELERAARSAVGVTEGKGRQIHAIIAQAGEDAIKERLTANKARRYLEQILKLSSEEELTVFSVRAWANEWLERKRSTLGNSESTHYQNFLGSFVEWLGPRADVPLDAIAATEIRKFRDSLREGRTKKTVNDYVRCIGAMYRAAIREGVTVGNPVDAIEFLPQTDSVSRKPFTVGEVQRLVAAAPTPDWKGLILVGAYAGLRLSDAAKLKWKDVDLALGAITTIPRKTRKKGLEIRIPLAKPLREFFERHPISDDPEAAVFPSLADALIAGKKGLSAQFSQLMESAGVSKGAKGKNGHHERSFHSLRHSFVSWMANSGIHPELRQALSGHSSSAVHQLYTKFEFSSLQGAVDRLPGLGEGP